jgi:hypothetical protein
MEKPWTASKPVVRRIDAGGKLLVDARGPDRRIVEALRAAAARAAEDDVASVVELVDDTPAIERLKRKLRPPLGPIADVIVVGPSTHRRLHG